MYRNIARKTRKHKKQLNCEELSKKALIFNDVIDFLLIL